MKKLITKKLIKDGLKANLIQPELRDDGLIAYIGSNWFYFGGSEFEQTKPEDIQFDVLVNEIKIVLDDFQTEFEDEYLYYFFYLNEKLGGFTRFVKTEMLLDDSGREFDLGRTKRSEAYLGILSKEDALRLFDEGKRVYFLYRNNRIYKCNCRKVCKNRDYLIDHYDVYHDVCGVVC